MYGGAALDFAEIVNLIGGETTTLALAIVALWMLDRTGKARIEDAKKATEKAEKREDLMRDALDRNTEAWARMLERVGGK